MNYKVNLILDLFNEEQTDIETKIHNLDIIYEKKLLKIKKIINNPIKFDYQKNQIFDITNINKYNTIKNDLRIILRNENIFFSTVDDVDTSLTTNNKNKTWHLYKEIKNKLSENGIEQNKLNKTLLNLLYINS
jgi:hypothetical protein